MVIDEAQMKLVFENEKVNPTQLEMNETGTVVKIQSLCYQSNRKSNLNMSKIKIL